MLAAAGIRPFSAYFVVFLQVHVYKVEFLMAGNVKKHQIVRDSAVNIGICLCRVESKVRSHLLRGVKRYKDAPKFSTG